MIDLRCGDCLDVLPTLGYVDAVVTDPLACDPIRPLARERDAIARRRIKAALAEAA